MPEAKLADTYEFNNLWKYFCLVNEYEYKIHANITFCVFKEQSLKACVGCIDTYLTNLKKIGMVEELNFEKKAYLPVFPNKYVDKMSTP